MSDEERIAARVFVGIAINLMCPGLTARIFHGYQLAIHPPTYPLLVKGGYVKQGGEAA